MFLIPTYSELLGPLLSAKSYNEVRWSHSQIYREIDIEMYRRWVRNSYQVKYVKAGRKKDENEEMHRTSQSQSLITKSQILPQHTWCRIGCSIAYAPYRWAWARRLCWRVPYLRNSARESKASSREGCRKNLGGPYSLGWLVALWT